MKFLRDVLNYVQVNNQQINKLNSQLDRAYVGNDVIVVLFCVCSKTELFGK
jgi:hypothetical protein